MAPFGFSIAGVSRLLGRPAPIRAIADMEDFIDRHAAFSVQKCIVEYCRARSGIQWSKLFKEKAFLSALDHARWNALGIGVGNVAEMIDAALGSRAAGDRAERLEMITAAGRRVLRRYSVPDGEADDFWPRAVAAFERRMAAVALRAPRPVKDIATPTAREVFDLLPIHADLRGHDFELIKNNLRANLCRSYESFVERVEAGALIAALAPPRGAGNRREEIRDMLER